MKYSEMIKFLSENNIGVMQPVIANEVDSQLETDVDDEEFESICKRVYGLYLGCFGDVDIWDLVDTELVNRGYKE